MSRAGAARARAQFESAVILFLCMYFLFLSTFDPLKLEQSFCLLTFLTSQYTHIYIYIYIYIYI